jgi:hypothetical protein
MPDSDRSPELRRRLIRSRISAGSASGTVSFHGLDSGAAIP